MVSSFARFAAAAAGVTALYFGLSQIHRTAKPIQPAQIETYESTDVAFNEILYGELSEGDKGLRYYKPSSHAAILGNSDPACSAAPEDCLLNAFTRRYNDITKQYLESIKGQLPDVLGITDGFSVTKPSSLTKRDLNRSATINAVYETPRKKDSLELVKSRAEYKVDDKPWTLEGLPFVSREYMLTPYFPGLPLHGRGDGIGDNDVLIIDKYNDGSHLFRAAISNRVPGNEADRLVFSHPYVPSESPGFGKVEYYIIGGEGLLQREKVEIFKIKPEVLGRLTVPKDSVFNLSSHEGAQVRNFFRNFRSAVIDLDSAIANQKN